MKNESLIKNKNNSNNNKVIIKNIFGESYFFQINIFMHTYRYAYLYMRGAEINKYNSHNKSEDVGRKIS